jgi:hypothetical protein
MPTSSAFAAGNRKSEHGLVAFYLEDQIFGFFAFEISGFLADDECGAVVRVNNTISNIKWHFFLLSARGAGTT